MANKQAKKSPKVKDKQKTVVRTILKNPFAVDLSPISKEVEGDLIKCIEECFSDLQVPVFKPPWREVRILKGEMRTKYCQEYKKSKLEELLSDPDSAEKYKKALEARSHLVFGFNAVIRKMEQNQLSGILCRKDVTPTFLVQSLLPGCIEKGIPFVPVEELDGILQRENTLGVKHKVMLLGLKRSVQEPANRFYPLYNIMRKSIGSMHKVYEEMDIDMNALISKSASTKNNKENQEEHMDMEESIIKFESDSEDEEELPKQDVSVSKLTPEEIKSYHLIRSGGKAKRVFIPSQKPTTEPFETGDVIAFDSLKTEELAGEIEQVRSNAKDEVDDVEHNFWTRPLGDEDIELVLDTTGCNVPSENEKEDNKTKKDLTTMKKGEQKTNKEVNTMKKGEQKMNEEVNTMKKGEQKMNEEANTMKKGEQKTNKEVNTMKKGEQKTNKEVNTMKKGEQKMNEEVNTMKNGKRKMNNEVNTTKKGKKKMKMEVNMTKKEEKTNQHINFTKNFSYIPAQGKKIKNNKHRGGKKKTKNNQS